MSVAHDLTQCQARLAEAGRKASAEARRLKGVAPPAVYDELMLQLCAIAACATDLKINLGALRMMGELEEIPPPVTTDKLELARCLPPPPVVVPAFPPRELSPPGPEYWRSLHRAGDHSMDDTIIDRHVSVDENHGGGVDA